MKIKHVLIGIQARSGSKRFPEKCSAMIGRKRLLDHVIDNCMGSALYMNSGTSRDGFMARVVLLVPVSDRLALDKDYRKKIPIFEGSEFDVLRRYKAAADKYEADYIVRITGDCPLIPPHVISKLTTTAIKFSYDYLTNADERVRTTIDGHDCEVLSKRLLDYLDESAISPYDREHVTTLLRQAWPEWAKMAPVIGYFDQSHIKLSVDTPEDLIRARREYETLCQKTKEAVRLYGNIHRF